MTTDAQAREAVGDFIGRSGEIARHIAIEAMRQLDYAKMLGALPDEIGFDVALSIQTRIR